MEPERTFAYSWPAYYGEDADRDGSEDPHLVVTFSLVKEDEGTLITLIESGFAKLPPDYAPTAYRLNEGGWDYAPTAYRLNEGGWVEQIQNIGAHVND